MDHDPNLPNNPVPPSRPRSPLPTTEGPLRVIVEQPSSFWGRTARRVLWAGLIFSILMNFSLMGAYQKYFDSGDKINERYHSLSKESTNKIAIIHVDGTIMAGEGFVKDQIDRIREDQDVKAVVLRVDSPGGTVTGSDYIYHHLNKLKADRKLPLVVSMGSLAASGGYYVAMAAGDVEKSIYAEPTTWTGSIGVIIPHYDVSGLLEKWDIDDDSITSGKFKQMGSPFRKLPGEEGVQERAILQGLVDDSFARFRKIVLDSRPELRKSEEKQTTVFTGRIFTADQAKANGLVDELGFVEDAIDRALQLAGLSKDNARVVEYKQPETLSALLSGNSRQSSMSFDLRQLFDFVSPRAFYLYTVMPGMTASGR